MHILHALSGSRLVQRDGLADECDERSLVDLVAFVQVDGTSGIALETGVEQPLWVLELRALEEGQLDDALVGLAGADQSIVGPDGHASPFPLLNHVGVRSLDKPSDL